MKDLAPAQFHNHEYRKDTESGCEHDEEVAGHHRLGMIANEGQPALARIGLAAGALPQILADGARRHPDAQLQLQQVTIGSDKPVDAPVGQAFYIKGGTPHGFRNLGSTPGSAIEIFVMNGASAASLDALGALVAGLQTAPPQP
jgi:hypothetical protein